jgi:hypothetical protein
MFNNFYDFFFFASARSKDANKNALIKKNWTGLNIFYLLLDMLIGRFQYTLPETCDARFLELCLLNAGHAAIARDKKTGNVMNFSIVAGSNFSPYGYLNNYNLCDFMGKNYGRYIPDTPGNETFADSVYVRNSDYNIAPIMRVYWYADRLTQIQSSLNAAINNLRGSVIISCSKEQERAVKRAYQNVDNGLPIVIVTGMDGDTYQDKPNIMTNPQTPDIVRVLQETYDKTLAQFCVEFGINGNGVINKLSGVSTTELEQNDQVIEIRLQQELNQRKAAMERAQAMFDEDFDVTLAFRDEDPVQDDTIEDLNDDDSDAIMEEKEG